MANLIGQTLKNRYQVIESLGRGRMVEVYNGWDEPHPVCWRSNCCSMI